MIRKLVVNTLYNVANACCIAADRLSPPDDSIWRQRRWLQYMLDWPQPFEAVTPTEPRPLGEFGPDYPMAEHLMGAAAAEEMYNTSGQPEPVLTPDEFDSIADEVLGDSDV